jgi:hypothetical protein
MRQFKLSLIFIIFSVAVYATECVERFFIEEHINLYLCQNYSNYHETTTLLFKARTKILNDYIAAKIKNKELQEKKFEIRIYDAILSAPHLDLTQSDTQYFVNMSDYPSLEKLLIIIDSFSKTNWKPFIAVDAKDDFDTSLRKIDAFFETHSKTTNTQIPDISFPIWSKDDLSLVFQNDALVYMINGDSLPVSPTSSLPVQIKDRFLLFQWDMIYVLQNGKIIKRLKIESPISSDYDMYSSDNSVKICYGGEDNCIYIYSYKENKFSKC